jgi:hypothetical protein
MEKSMTVLLELKDNTTSILIKGLLAEVAELREKLAQRPRPSANYRDSWTKERRALQSVRQKARWARKHAEEAAATASSHVRDGLSVFPNGNGNGHSEHDWL